MPKPAPPKHPTYPRYVVATVKRGPLVEHVIRDRLGGYVDGPFWTPEEAAHEAERLEARDA